MSPAPYKSLGGLQQSRFNPFQMVPMRSSSALITAFLALGACQGSSADLGVAEKSIIGGNENRFDDAVVAVYVGGLCTGTLVAPRVVLTAAHCVGDAIEAGYTNYGSVRFGNGVTPWIKSIQVMDMAMHRLYSPPAFLQHDIALLRLAEAAPEDIKPIPISTRHLTDDHIGLQIRVVGFGNDDGAAASGSGIKRQVTLPLREVRPGHIGIGDHLYNTCQGDSGGPSFASFDGVEHVVGVTSYGANQCRAISYMTRADARWDDFLTEVMNAWSGPCQQDGTCVEEGCDEYPDPDCDPCGMDGRCAGGKCPTPDRDCPLASLLAGDCSDDSDCESRACVEAPDDARIKYCSMSCDPSKTGPASGCAAPLSDCVAETDGTGRCHYSGLTPGVQGSSCSEGSVCRSSMCDAEEGICVEACGEGEPACGEGFECLEKGDLSVCTLPPDGGCNVGAGTSSGLMSGLMLLLALALGRRRRKLVTRS